MGEKELSKSKLAVINSSVAIVQQLVSVVAGFILPRLILVYYGSAYNGLISSISQVLSCIILLNGGVGGVTRAALYKSLKERDNKKISSIIKATESYLHKIALIFAGIVVLLSILYPIRVKGEFSDWGFVCTLVLILAITNFSQYFFALAFQTLLTADQKQYIKSIVNIVCVILSTAFSSLLIILRVDIRIVKLAAAVCFAGGAVFIRSYTIRKYSLDKKVEPDNSAIKQRWNAFAHTVANFIHSNTDIVVLTLFTNSLEISVYTVYYLVLNGMKMLFEPINTSIEALFGNTMAQESKEKLQDTFAVVERLIFITATFIFSVCSILIVPFIMIYTKGVEDVNYYRMAFAVVACTAELLYCLRIPYQAMVQAFGHFKQTRNGAIIEAVLNIVISIVLVQFIGLLGVAIGTLIAMLFRTIQYAYYTYKKLLGIDIKRLLRQFLTMAIVYGGSCFAGILLLRYIVVDNWGKWILAAIILAALEALIVLLSSYLFERKGTRRLFQYILHRKNTNKNQ